MTAEPFASIAAVRVGVVDVGSNTVRLLVADRHGSAVDCVEEDRDYLKLGAEIQQLGWVSDAKLASAVRTVREFTRRARELGAADIEVVVTAPGRRAANADELVEALRAGTGTRVRVLTAEEEGALAWSGAVAGRRLVGTVAVCDVGGGSAELAVGTPEAGPVWLRSAPVGALTVTENWLGGDPPSADEVQRARDEVADALADFVPPAPMHALATGGTARALRKVCGKSLGADELECAIRRLAKRSAEAVVDDFDIGRDRAATLLGGAIVLAEVQRRVVAPLEIAKTGMREGVALSLLAEAAAA
jgi:exopolyphosphatase/guanosine-5'-triphosphate,3'-diphosphate pyrophosphatase